METKPTTLNSQKDIAGFFNLPEQVIPQLRGVDSRCPIRKGTDGGFSVNVVLMEKFLETKRQEVDRRESGGDDRYPGMTNYKNSKII
ncbi:MAG: hypothetical protein B6240_14740 [Desulfobacteraceae bacterium 4572_87]|nr:MAG: hypothetical protein B6240_14740 [Desulfobacteraceae bacterium 4572_87]